MKIDLTEEEVSAIESLIEQEIVSDFDVLEQEEIDCWNNEIVFFQKLKEKFNQKQSEYAELTIQNVEEQIAIDNMIDCQIDDMIALRHGVEI